MEKKKVIFIVEDDPGFNMLMTNFLTSKQKWEIHSFQSGEECLVKLDLKPDIFLQDFDLPGINGIEVLKQVKQKLPQAEFIFLSAQTDIKVAVEALKQGAFDYVMKDSNAKESALNKIDQLMLINRLMKEKQNDRKGKIAFFSLFCITLLILIILWLSGLIK